MTSPQHDTATMFHSDDGVFGVMPSVSFPRSILNLEQKVQFESCLNRANFSTFAKPPTFRGPTHLFHTFPDSNYLMKTLDICVGHIYRVTADAVVRFHCLNVSHIQ
ncbi:hypothetical protein ATANTOWER_024916 [Ataeniobius toweri]|uniref:Uncharacterized protein n=1 Tax=Ataeniobius toweri TaxID=208326 RepID=A0ABU7CAJ0_9TELE|nr:hypothetical protein [Ataeniobius toweri]